MTRWEIGSWGSDWSFGLTLTVLTLLLHILGLGLLHRVFERLLALFDHRMKRSLSRIVAIVGPIVALIFGLHAGEALVWAIAYVLIGAVPDLHTASLYSLGAMSTYGHAAIYLAPEWQLLGAIQALNGMITFGLTVAFMAAVLRRVSSVVPF
ncbi:hypothetical protein [Falsiroseomonas sp. HW251]|uniref:hypothetical protein n=1 Tax=Falsiroseomonas sp. HW251 TaxID=3390998 RepID=UPI003D318E5B